MIFHSVYSISIGRFAEMQIRKKHDLVKRINIWLPKKIIEKNYAKLIEAYNDLVNKDEILKMIEDDAHKIEMTSRYFMLESLYKYLSIKLKTASEPMREIYKHEFGKYPTIIKDVKEIPKRMKLISQKFDALYGHKPVISKDFDFMKMIKSIEMSLGFRIDNNCKLYELPYYIQLANDKNKKNG